jgi:glycosyltransferase involved in cell wall biosynthesis
VSLPVQPPTGAISDNGGAPANLVVASCAFDDDIADPEAALERYHAMTGWAEAVGNAGADSVTVVQRFHRDATIRRGSVEYRFVDDGGAGLAPPWFVGARVAAAVRRARPTAVHVDGLIFPALVRALRWVLPRSAAIVVQDHGGVRLDSGALQTPKRRLLYGLGLGAADGFMFTTREQALPWQIAGIIRSSHAVHEILESSTDMASWPPGGDATQTLPGRPSVLWVGRLDENKDPLTVLEGFARATVVLPDAALTMVYGDDRMLPEVQAFILRHPALQSRVHLRGRVDRRALPGFYAAADIFVLGSHREVACFSLIEALSLGVTPVVTDIPAFRSLTRGGRVGSLFPAGDPGGLASALETVARSDVRARRPAVRDHFERELSWAAVGRRALAIYREAAAKRRFWPTLEAARWPAT